MNANKFTLGAFAILFDENKRVLLCHRRDLDVWNLPGGGVETGELPTETVQREVREETGLEVEIIRLAGVYAKSSNPTDLVFSFTCRISGGEITPTDEADRIESFSLDALPGNTVPNQVERIFDAARDLPQPV
ncbi:MAG: NUDIX hydrolase, partial [Chloroflexota bacterium]